MIEDFYFSTITLYIISWELDKFNSSDNIQQIDIATKSTLSTPFRHRLSCSSPGCYLLIFALQTEKVKDLSSHLFFPTPELRSQSCDIDSHKTTTIIEDWYE